MGRIFEVRKHTMFARWNRMAKQFARIAKDISMAVKAGGADPGSNPTLRRIMQNARTINMPKDKVEAAVKRASGRDATHYHEVLYEGYAPHGVALLIETATDNPTRTVAHVRNIITRYGGNLGTTGSVSFQFRKLGVFRLDPSGIDQDELELDMIDHRVTPVSAEHEYLCLAATELSEPQANEALELIDKLEQEEDVQRVFHSLA